MAPHLGNTGIKRKSSATSGGVAKRSKPYTSGYQHSDRYGRRKKSRTTYGRKASVIRTVAREVAKINRVPQHMSRAAQNITVRASAPATFSFPATTSPITFLPVSWAIPPFQLNGKHPDERFRESNIVYLTGVRVRFSVRYLHTFRMRMICYSPPSIKGVANFTKVVPVRITSDTPTSNINLDWVGASDPLVIPGGPFANTLIDRQRNDGGYYTYDSVDGTLYNADVSKTIRPKGDFKLAKNVAGIDMTQVEDIDWYVPIGENVTFEHERSAVALDGNFQILVYCDLPLV